MDDQTREKITALKGKSKYDPQFFEAVHFLDGLHNPPVDLTDRIIKKRFQAAELSFKKMLSSTTGHSYREKISYATAREAEELQNILNSVKTELGLFEVLTELDLVPDSYEKSGAYAKILIGHHQWVIHPERLIINRSETKMPELLRHFWAALRKIKSGSRGIIADGYPSSMFKKGFLLDREIKRIRKSDPDYIRLRRFQLENLCLSKCLRKIEKYCSKFSRSEYLKARAAFKCLRKSGFEVWEIAACLECFEIFPPNSDLEWIEFILADPTAVIPRVESLLKRDDITERLAAARAEVKSLREELKQLNSECDSIGKVQFLKAG